MKPSITVNAQIYTDSQARNWLAIHGTSITPTKLGNMEIVFASEDQKLEFCLRFGQYYENDILPNAQ